MKLTTVLFTLLALSPVSACQDILTLEIPNTTWTRQLNLTAVKLGKVVFNATCANPPDMRTQITDLIDQAATIDCGKECCYDLCFAIQWIPEAFWPCCESPFSYSPVSRLLVLMDAAQLPSVRLSGDRYHLLEV